MKSFLGRAAITAIYLAFSTGSASAHVVLDQKTATAGPYKATFNIPHGCAGSATVTVRLTIPEGFIGVKPQPKPGWTLTTTTGAYAKPYDYFHGSKLSEGAKEVIWSGGKLDDTNLDEFKIVGFVSDAFKPGDTVYFPITQQCEQGSLNWSEIPAEGSDPHALKYPAPSIKIIAPPEAEQHHH